MASFAAQQRQPLFKTTLDQYFKDPLMLDIFSNQIILMDIQQGIMEFAIVVRGLILLLPHFLLAPIRWRSLYYNVKFVMFLHSTKPFVMLLSIMYILHFQDMLNVCIQLGHCYHPIFNGNCLEFINKAYQYVANEVFKIPNTKRFCNRHGCKLAISSQLPLQDPNLW